MRAFNACPEGQGSAACENYPAKSPKDLLIGEEGETLTPEMDEKGNRALGRHLLWV
jgi:hypothetical protein